MSVAKATATMVPRGLSDGTTVVDVTVLFSEFPRVGAIRTNRPYCAINKNGEQVFEDQSFFTGTIYQLDAERVPYNDGDTLEVVAWWGSEDVRDGVSREQHTVATWPD